MAFLFPKQQPQRASPRLRAALAGMVLASACLLGVVQAQSPSGLEIQFEPFASGGDEGIPKDLLEMLSGGDAPNGPLDLSARKNGGQTSAGANSKDKKEAELDDVLNSMLGDLMGAGTGRHRSSHHRHRGGSPFMSPFGPFGGGLGGLGGGAHEIVIEDGRGGPPMVMELEGASPFGPPRHSFPAEMFRDLFPGPIAGDMPMSHAQPFEEPDPLVQNLVKDLDKTFLGLMGSIQKAASADRAPNSCQQDIKASCQESKSKVHCLGLHPETVSDACRKDIGKSVPFRCGTWIDKFCDVMEVGILNCLGDHISEVGDECRDAVLATHHVISKANTQKAAVVDTSSGAKQISSPSLAVTPPPPVEGAAHPTASLAQLPKGVLDLLGVPNSVGSLAGAGAAGGHRLLWVAAALAILVALVYLLPSTSWPVRKLRTLVPSRRSQEGQQLLKSGVELPKPADMPILNV